MPGISHNPSQHIDRPVLYTSRLKAREIKISRNRGNVHEQEQPTLKLEKGSGLFNRNLIVCLHTSCCQLNVPSWTPDDHSPVFLWWRERGTAAAKFGVFGNNIETTGMHEKQAWCHLSKTHWLGLRQEDHRPVTLCDCFPTRSPRDRALWRSLMRVMTGHPEPFIAPDHASGRSIGAETGSPP